MLKKLIVAMLSILLATASPLLAAKGYQTEFRRTKSSQSVVNFSLGNYSIKEVNINGVNYSKIVYEGKVVTNRKGYAELPFINANVELSADRNVSLEIGNTNYTDIKLSSPLLPSRGEIYRNQHPETIPYEIDPQSVVDSWYPAKQADLTEPFIFREVRGTNVYVYPFAYNAKTKTLRVYSNVEVVLNDDSTTPVNPLKSGLKTFPVMNDVYSSMFVNYNKNDRFLHQAGEDGDILVIHTARDAAAIAPYVTWKKEKGFKVTTLQVATGASATVIKTAIQTAYTSNPNLLYVQLVGDWVDIKSETCSVTSSADPMDPMLGCVVGTDLYPELMIGRFSGSTAAHITTQVNKAINYEKNPDMNAATNGWYKKGLGIGSEQGSGQGDDDEADYVHIGIIKNNKLLPTTYTTVAEAYQSVAVTAASVPINAGLSIINYCGHGASNQWVTTGYSNTNVNASTNGSKLPFIFSVACVNGAFHESSDCFAEAWLKKENGGAVVTLMSTINQPWVPPMIGQDYFNDILTGGYNYTTGPGDGTNTTASDARTTFGSVALNGNVLMLAENATNTDTKNTIQTWTTFGDASLQIRTNIPKALTISNTTLLLGANFTTKITNNGTPVANAWVSLSQNDTYFRGKTDANGDVSIANTLVAGTAKLTVTGFNTETKYEDISVVPPNGPYLILDGYSVGQNGTGTHATYGKEIKVNLNLKNVGTSASNQIVVTAASTSPYIQSFSDNTENLASLAVNATQELSNALTFTLKNNIPDQTPVTITMVITDNSTKKVYDAELTLLVDAPILKLSHSLLGGGPTVVPGAERTVNYKVINSGHAGLTSVTADLSQTTTANVTIGTTNFNIGSLNANDSVTVNSLLTFGADIPLNTITSYKYRFQATNIDTSYYNNIKVCLEPDTLLFEGFESTWAPTGWTVSGTTAASYNWNRDDTQTSGTYTPAGANSSAHSAKYHSYMAPEGSYGELTSKVFSTIDIDTLKISFWYINKAYSSGNSDKLEVFFSKDNGATWGTAINTCNTEDVWKKFNTVIVGQNSANCKLKFKATSDYGYTDIGLDEVSVICPPPSLVSIIDAQTPQFSQLFQNYPNPFNPETTIRFFSKDNALVKLAVYNLKGELVANLVNSNLNAGAHDFKFNANGLASGVYIYKLQIGNQSMVKSMLLLK